MAKGCCSKVEAEEEPVEGINRTALQTDPNESKGSKKAHKDNLILYQRQMEKDPNNNSLTKAVLTKEMALENADIRGSSNEGLGQCVYVNVNNLKCRMPYAVSSDCYNTFADFFGEIVERIHGVPKGDGNLYPDFGDLKSHELIDLNSFDRKRHRVLYSEMIIRRNIQQIPFTPMMSSGDRNKVISEIESKVRSIFEKSEEIASIPLEWEERLHSIANELDDMEAMKHYPSERVMLHFKTEDKLSQGCVLNYDDHIQYIVSRNDGRVGQLINKMNNIICNRKLEEINYSTHPIYNHLTLSPEYVGTGFSIRVLAKFPFISRLEDVNSMIFQYDTSVKFETDNINTGMLFLYSNKTLNKTENEIFTDMVSAFNKLSLLEDELELFTPMSVQQDNVGVEKMDTLVERINKKESKSYTKKFLTKTVISQYENVKTCFGTTLNHCICHNSFYPNSLFPRACDTECYTVFNSFFSPILFQTNNIKSFKHSSNPQYGSANGNKLYLLCHPDIYSYRVRFCRNFEKFPFPIMMSDKDRKDVEKIMVDLFSEIPVELEGEYISLGSLKDSIYYEEILKYKFIPSPNEVDASSGLYSNWPKHRGLYFIKQNHNYPNIFLVILINFTDHIKVISLDPTGKSLNVCYDRAINLMKFLDLRFMKDFAQKLGYGFLTTLPNSVGCGMRISALLKLENLGKHREVLERECISLQFAYRGSFGHGTVASNCVFDLSIKLNLNITEKWVLMIFTQRLKDLILTERQYNPRIARPSNEDNLDLDYLEDYDEDSDEGEDEDKMSNHSESSKHTSKLTEQGSGKSKLEEKASGSIIDQNNQNIVGILRKNRNKELERIGNDCPEDNLSIRENYRLNDGKIKYEKRKNDIIDDGTQERKDVRMKRINKHIDGNFIRNNTICDIQMIKVGNEVVKREKRPTKVMTVAPRSLMPHLAMNKVEK